MREEKLSIPNSIGGTISAVVHYPDQESKGLAILCPGHLDTKDYDHLVRLGKNLADVGYEQYSMPQYLEDIRVVIDFMFREATYRDVVLIGHSIGGMLSMVYAARDSRVTKVVGIMAPYIYLRPNLEEERGEKSEWARTGFRISRRDVPGSKRIVEFSVPYSFVRDAKKYNVLDEVPKFETPLLLIAGEKDDLVPPEYVKMIYDKANEPKKFVVMEGIGHDYRYHPEEIKRVNKEIISFLIKTK
jgi:pimeloyl-ACP methyl ester carboxylesterase